MDLLRYTEVFKKEKEKEYIIVNKYTNQQIGQGFSQYSLAAAELELLDDRFMLIEK